VALVLAAFDIPGQDDVLPGGDRELVLRHQPEESPGK
jgi:hypothetical protein